MHSRAAGDAEQFRRRQSKQWAMAAFGTGRLTCTRQHVFFAIRPHMLFCRDCGPARGNASETSAAFAPESRECVHVEGAPPQPAAGSASNRGEKIRDAADAGAAQAWCIVWQPYALSARARGLSLLSPLCVSRGV